MTMDDHNRKGFPLASGVLDYFPDALLAVASVSLEGARKHDTFNSAGYPTWDRSKSADDADALARHLLGRGKFDTDGHRHSAKVAWRALAVLQKELDAAAEYAAIDGDDYMRRGDGATAQATEQNRIDQSWAEAAVAEPRRAKAAAAEPRRAKVAQDTNLHMADDLLRQAEVRKELPILAADFAMWLTTRDKCMHAGRKHSVVEVLDALEEFTQLMRGEKDAIDSRRKSREINRQMREAVDRMVMGYDIGRLGGDETKIAVFGDEGMALDEIAKWLGVPRSSLVDARGPKR